MDIAYQHNLFARLLLTVVCLGYGVGLIIADLNSTHATNPLWTPHARFHVVWQVLSYTALSVVGLGLVWMPGPAYVARLYLTCILSSTVFASFFIAIAAMKIFRGSLKDPNGVQPIAVALGQKIISVDKNVMVFSILVACLIAAFLVISAGNNAV